MFPLGHKCRVESIDKDAIFYAWGLEVASKIMGDEYSGMTTIHLPVMVVMDEEGAMHVVPVEEVKMMDVPDLITKFSQY